MKTILVKTGEKLAWPTIVNINEDYYIVSKLFSPDKMDSEKYIAINLKDGKWFDWGDEIPKFEPPMEVFRKGTKFEIEI